MYAPPPTDKVRLVRCETRVALRAGEHPVKQCLCDGFGWSSSVVGIVLYVICLACLLETKHREWVPQVYVFNSRIS